MTAAVRWRLAAILLPAVLISGCVSSNLSFRVDKRLHITSPKQRSEVSLPFDLTWTIRDFAVKSAPTDVGGSFAVFLDRSPVPPGKPLSWLARNDSTCHITPKCPDAAYLADLGVYQTTDTRLIISALADDSSSSTDDTSRHNATIILLDDDGKRIGEIAYNVTFELKRKG
jgi:hypothetical protein